jgi:hypothetical protein
MANGHGMIRSPTEDLSVHHGTRHVFVAVDAIQQLLRI